MEGSSEVAHNPVDEARHASLSETRDAREVTHSEEVLELEKSWGEPCCRGWQDVGLEQILRGRKPLTRWSWARLDVASVSDVASANVR